MTRAFTGQEVQPALVDRLIDLARRGPSAGNTAGIEWLVLEGPTVDQYWAITLPPERREGFPWPGLFDAPVLIVPWVDPDAYVARYGEADKAGSGLGAGAHAWPVPYWFVDGGAAVMTLLLAAEDAGLGALLFGLFDHEPAVRRAFGVPDGRRAVGAVALGHPGPDRPSSSSARGRPPLAAVLHRGRW